MSKVKKICRFDLVTAAVLLLPYYCISILMTEVQAIPTDDTIKKSVEIYDLFSGDSTVTAAAEPIKQTLSMYHDYVITNSKDNYVPDSDVTLTAAKDITDENNQLKFAKTDGNEYGLDSDEVNQHETTTTPALYQTTHNLDSNTSDDYNDLVDAKLNDNAENASQAADKDDTLRAKHGKFLAADYESAEIQLAPVYVKRQPNQSDQSNVTNDADDIDDFDETDNYTQTTMYPVTTPMVLKKPTQQSTITTTKKPITTTVPMHIYKFSADEILRKFLEDSYIRSPLAALIDTSPECLRKSKRLWKASLRPNAAVDIVLVAYNSSGVGVTYSFKNTRTMEAGLDSIQESTGPEYGGNAFYGIVRASELVPYDSAIFISTDSIPLDTNLAQYAAITLLKKRIRLYLIWFGPQSPEDNETQGQNTEGGILGEVALRSGGEILRITEEASGPDGDLGLITLYLSNDIQGAHELDIPVDTTASNLQIKFQGNVETATLDTTVGG